MSAAARALAGTAAAKPMGACPKCGKARFRTRAIAKQAARNLLAKYGTRFRVYPCTGTFHLTSADAAKAAAIRERRAKRPKSTAAKEST